MDYNVFMKWFIVFHLLLLSYSASSTDVLLISAAYLPENVEEYQGQSPSGRDFEIFEKIMNCAGAKFKVEIQPYMRHIKTYKNGKKYDGVMTVPVPLEIEKGHKTKPYVSYHNGVFVRSEDFPNGLTSLDDLKGKHVITFIGGKEILKGVKNKIPLFASYKESTSQFNHNEILVRKRTDAVFTDGLIFMAHHSRLLKKKPKFKSVKLKFYSIFKTNRFRAIFKDKKLQSKFDQCNEKLSEQGLLDEIERKYVLKYAIPLGQEYLKPLLHIKKAGNYQ